MINRVLLEYAWNTLEYRCERQLLIIDVFNGWTLSPIIEFLVATILFEENDSIILFDVLENTKERKRATERIVNSISDADVDTKTVFDCYELPLDS